MPAFPKPTATETDPVASPTAAAALALAGAKAAKASNLSDLTDASAARTNLGLGTAATHAHSDYATAAQGVRANNATPKGIYVPAGWGGVWLPKVRAGSKATVSVVGDSVDAGYFASLKSKTWAGLMKTSLQAIGGDGGSGYISTERAQAVTSGVASFTNKLAVTGTWADGGAPKAGPGGCAITSTTNGSTATFPVRGSTVTIFSFRYTGFGDFTYAIDGGSPVTVSCAGAYDITKTTITGLSTGDHSVVITKSGTSPVSILGVSGENASGVVMNNFSLSSTKTEFWNNANAPVGYTSGRWSGGDLYPSDLAIYGALVNDAQNQVAVDTLITNIEAYLYYVVGNGATNHGATDLLFVIKHIGKWDYSVRKYHTYVTAVKALGEQYGAAVIDLWTIYRNNWDAFADVSGWGTSSSSPGTVGTDVVHLSDIGNQLYADQITPIVAGTDSRFAFAA